MQCQPNNGCIFWVTFKKVSVGVKNRLSSLVDKGRVWKIPKSQLEVLLNLDVYQSTYEAPIIVLTKIIPKLPKEEKFDLAQQLRRSVKAVPRLIAESYSKRHQNRGFQGLIDDAIEESNETIVSLSHVKDAYKIEVELSTRLIDVYDKASRQLYNLSLAWSNFKERRQTKPKYETDR